MKKANISNKTNKIKFNYPFTNEGVMNNTLSSIKSNPFDVNGHRDRLTNNFNKSMLINKEREVYFVNSATNALEIMALSIDIHKGDEIIMPSYTYAATANAFARQGAKLVFVDIEKNTLNIDPKAVAAAVSDKTKAIIPIHYGGFSADLDALNAIAKVHNCLVLEDAAHGTGATYNNRALGTIGHMGCLSFHHTKNITAGGQGGALFVNDSKYKGVVDEVIFQGTNRQAFLDGEVSSYQWARIGGEYQMTTFGMAFLNESLDCLNEVTQKRMKLWERYQSAFKELEDDGLIKLAKPSKNVKGNGHIFYLILKNESERVALKAYLMVNQIEAYTHYEPLHVTDIGRKLGAVRGTMSNTENTYNGLLRLPLYYDLTDNNQMRVIDVVKGFFKKK